MIKQCDVWLVNLNATQGAEIRKQRPVIVLSNDAVRALPIKLVVPVTGWKDAFENRFWLVATSEKGLTKASAADTLQMRGLDTQRFIKRMGQLDEGALEDIRDAINLLISARA